MSDHIIGCTHPNGCSSCGYLQYFYEQVNDAFDIDEGELMAEYFGPDYDFECIGCGNKNCDHSVCKKCGDDYCRDCNSNNSCHNCHSSGCDFCIIKCEKCNLRFCEVCMEKNEKNEKDEKDVGDCKHEYY